MIKLLEKIFGMKFGIFAGNPNVPGVSYDQAPSWPAPQSLNQTWGAESLVSPSAAPGLASTVSALPPGSVQPAPAVPWMQTEFQAVQTSPAQSDAVRYAVAQPVAYAATATGGQAWGERMVLGTQIAPVQQFGAPTINTTFYHQGDVVSTLQGPFKVGTNIDLNNYNNRGSIAYPAGGQYGSKGSWVVTDALREKARYMNFGNPVNDFYVITMLNVPTDQGFIYHPSDCKVMFEAVSSPYDGSPLVEFDKETCYPGMPCDTKRNEFIPTPSPVVQQPTYAPPAPQAPAYTPPAVEYVGPPSYSTTVEATLLPPPVVEYTPPAWTTPPEWGKLPEGECVGPTFAEAIKGLKLSDREKWITRAEGYSFERPAGMVGKDYIELPVSLKNSANQVVETRYIYVMPNSELRTRIGYDAGLTLTSSGLGYRNHSIYGRAEAVFRTITIDTQDGNCTPGSYTIQLPIIDVKGNNGGGGPTNPGGFSGGAASQAGGKGTGGGSDTL